MDTRWRKSMKLLATTAEAVVVSIVVASAADIEQSPTFFGQPAPGLEPAIFLPDLVTAPHGKIVFAPDESELFWSVLVEEQPRGVINRARYDGAGFSEPAVASFADGYRSGGPALSYDGETLFFSSKRPYPGKNGAPASGIWFSVKTAAGWSEAGPVDATIDTGFAVGHPTVSRKGTLYFSYRETDTRTPTLYYSEFANEQYSAPRAAGGGLTDVAMMDPFIDPNERFILFVCRNCDAGIGPSDLYVSFRQPDSSWGEPIIIGNNISTSDFERFPSLSPDGRYLFFARAVGDSFTNNPQYYWVGAEILDSLRPR